MIEDLLKSPLVKKALEAGEVRVGKLVTAVLGNEKVMAGVQTAMAQAMSARATLEKGVRTAMQAVNLPTTDDVAELKRRLEELESIIDGLAARMDRPAEGEAAAPRQGEPDAGGEGASGGEGSGGAGR
jgi:hypothetical protein